MKIYHYRTRAYDPQSGRFLQTDPIGYYDSMNLYEYVYSNPANYVDPWGLWTYGGMYETYFSKYGKEGALLLRFADSKGYVPIKRDYKLYDWDYESGGVLGIASRWTDWSWSWPPKIWDYSDETAARQLHHALKSKFGRLAGKVAKCLCRLNVMYQYARQVGEDTTGFYKNVSMDSLAGETGRMEAMASEVGSYFQNEVVAEAKWALAMAVGGVVVRQGADAIDNVLDARRLGAAGRKTRAAQRLAPPRTRVPRSAGRWVGKTGNGKWYSNLDDVNRITKGKPIIFKNGRPDFSPWRKGVIKFKPGQLDGTKRDFRLVYQRIAKQRGMRSAKSAQEWLKANNLSPHHLNRTAMEIVPSPLNAIPHIGSASDLRRCLK